MTATALERPAARRRSPSPRKSTTYRLTLSTLALIDDARAITHQDRTAFLEAAASEKANELLRDRTLFRLSPQDHERFVAALDNPAPPNQALVELVHRKPLWERS